MAKLSINRFIITMNANARLELWFSSENNDKGRNIKEFMVINNLYVLNGANNPPTYFSSTGQSNIDITLASGSMLRFIKNWQVLEHCTSSDHNMIIFEVESHSNERRKSINQFTGGPEFNVLCQNW